MTRVTDPSERRMWGIRRADGSYTVSSREWAEDVHRFTGLPVVRWDGTQWQEQEVPAGVVLTPEEAADLAVAAIVAVDRLTEDGWAPRLRALAARLQAAAVR